MTNSWIETSGNHDAAIDRPSLQNVTYERIAQAIGFMREHHLEQPDLGSIAQQVHLSEYHFQRLFIQWAVTYLIPLFAMLWGAIVLQETVTVSMIAGCGLVLLGTASANELFKRSD